MKKRVKTSGPFTPQFGKKPLSFVGRQDIIDDLLDGLYDSNSPMRTTVISGVRGSGKTALLSDICEELRNEKDWIVISVGASDSILEDILEQLLYQGKRVLDKEKFELVSAGLNASLISLEFKKSKVEENSFYTKLMQMLDEIRGRDVSVLIAVDEVLRVEPIKILATTYQLLLRQGYDISLLLAGLPQNVLAVQNDDYLTFLKRAYQVFLKNIEMISFRIEYERIFSLEGKSFESDALDLAYLTTGGYPYLYQLIGYYIWKDSGVVIYTHCVQKAISYAVSDLTRNVLSIAVADLSRMEREFMFAMSLDSGASAISDIQKRLAKDANYVSQYRKNLVNRGLIERLNRGEYRFTLPYMKHYLEETLKEDRFRATD